MSGENRGPKNLASEASSVKKYESNAGIPSMANQEAQAKQAMQEFDKIKAKLEVFKKAVVKKYPYTLFIGLLPGNSSPLFEEDEALPKEVIDSKPLHLIVAITEDHFKDIPKIKPELIKLANETKENLWVHIKTPVDLWNYGLDSKFEMLEAVSASYPVFDNGFLGSLRVASIHKSLVLRKFEKYVASYVIGGSLVRGTAGKDSDVDVFIIIDDTDVKRMPRAELLDKLRGIILDYIREATALAGVKNILSPQIYLLTDFWQSVKDAHPVMFTFIRDGIPLWDRGTFIPWKLLLYSGRIKPSPEAIDLYMKQGEQTEEMVKRRLLDAMVDIYYGVVTPTQAIMMLAGMAPPTHKESPAAFREAFHIKEKLVEEKYLKILEKAVHLFREYEYGRIKEIPGKDIDVFMKECLDYNKMLKVLRKKIEKKMLEKSADELGKEIFKLLRSFFGDKKESELIKEFELKMIKKGKISPRFVNTVREISQIEKKLAAGKLDQKEFDVVKRDATELIQSIVEFAQRADIISAEKGTMQIIHENRKAELMLLGDKNFVVENRQVRKIQDGKLVESNKDEMEKAIAESKGKLSTKISHKVFEILRKEFGDFEILF